METIQKLSNVIVEFYEKLSNWEHDIVFESNLSLTQMHAVEILGINGSLKMKELAAKLGITTGTLTITIDKLEKKGIVRRKANPNDRRSYVIELTKEGKEIHLEHSNYHIQLTKECTVQFTEDDKNKFLNYIISFMQEM